MCTAANLYRGVHIPWPGGPLQEVHQRVLLYHTALSMYLTGEGASRKSEQVSLTKDAMEAFESIETGMHDGSHLSVHRLHQTIPVGDSCIQGWIGGGVVTEVGRWAVSPCCLWQQSPNTSQKNCQSTKFFSF